MGRYLIAAAVVGVAAAVAVAWYIHIPDDSPIQGGHGDIGWTR